MNNKNEKFEATEFVRTFDTTREVLPFNGDMAICLEQGIVIITKQQAIDFWGLCDSNPTVVNGDNTDQEKCTAIDGYCKHYSYQKNDVKNFFCNHKDNKERKCLNSACPILVKNMDEQYCPM